ncbi:MAG: hypothetical protein H0W62_14945 [Chitinophagales bacterium]|nr:hypothetical protein [Chitinophagales bacterium]
MKRKKYLLISIFLFVLIKTSFAQSEFLVNFSAIQNEQVVHLSFTLKGGITCLGTQIERATDGIHFAAIGSIAGVCGNSNFEVTYSYDDSMPVLNQSNFYRLQLGQLGYSQIVNLRVSDYSKGWQIIPNPATDEAVIYFQNKGNHQVIFKLYKEDGLLIKTVTTISNSIDLHKSDLMPGHYIFSIEENKEKRYSGHLVIL